MQKDNKSAVRISLESDGSRHSTFERLLEANFTQFFDENTTKDFMRSHQFIFTKPYFTTIEGRLISSEAKSCRGLGTCSLRASGYDRNYYVPHMYVDER